MAYKNSLKSSLHQILNYSGCPRNIFPFYQFPCFAGNGEVYNCRTSPPIDLAPDASKVGRGEENRLRDQQKLHTKKSKKYSLQLDYRVQCLYLYMRACIILIPRVANSCQLILNDFLSQTIFQKQDFTLC